MATLTLSPLAALGAYALRPHRRQEYLRSFEVQEYKKPEFEVPYPPTRPNILKVKTIQGHQRRYYFGAPVSVATVKYSIFAPAISSLTGAILWGDEEV